MSSDIYYTTNPDEWTALEGLYISEETPPNPVEGVDLFTVGLAGKCVRGPETPQFIGDKARFVEVYGTLRETPAGAIVGEVYKALLNKPFGSLVIRRIAAVDAALATHSFNATATPIIRVDASSRGAWGNSLKVAIEAATDAVSNHFNLRVDYLGKQVVYINLDVTTGNDNTLAVIGDDVGVWIKVTKLADGRPDNIALTALTAGSDGTAVDADYAAGITDLASYDGVAVCLVPEAAPTQATFNGTLVTLAASAVDRIFLTWSGVHNQSKSGDDTAKLAQITTPSRRIAWCYNTLKVVDPDTGFKIDVAPHTLMASILSQVAIDVHPGASEALPMAAGIAGVFNTSLSRGDLKQALKDGICCVENTKKGFRFRSAVMTDGSEIVDRRELDFILGSEADFLDEFVKTKNIEERRAQMAGGLTTFLSGLRDAHRIVEEFAVRTNVTTDNQRGKGIEIIEQQIRLVGHIRFLVLRTIAGTGVTVEATA